MTESLDLEQFLVPSKSSLPTMARELLYLPESNKWGNAAKMSKSDRSGGITDYLYAIEPARSSLSGCRRCGAKITKGDLRFGFFTADPRGELGVIAVWFHPGCAPVVHLGAKRLSDLVSKCQGFSELTTELQECILSLPPEDLSAKSSKAVDSLKDLVKRVLLPTHPPPNELLVSLLPFQAEGFAWMVNQELSSTRGGILADEMGMGKTLQAISLVLKRRQEVRPTLVVAPVAAVLQWHSEIVKFSGETLKVHVYHSTEKIPAAQLSAFDLVLTTYQTLEGEFRKEANKTKIPCAYCNKLFAKSKLKLHLKYFCGPDAERTAKQKLTARSEGLEKAKRTMGIGADTGYKPPTITNVFREIVGRQVSVTRRATTKKETADELVIKKRGKPAKVAELEQQGSSILPSTRPSQNPSSDDEADQRPRRAGGAASYKAILESSEEDEIVDKQPKNLEISSDLLKLTVAQLKQRLGTSAKSLKTKKDLIAEIIGNNKEVISKTTANKGKRASAKKTEDEEYVSSGSEVMVRKKPKKSVKKPSRWNRSTFQSSDQSDSSFIGSSSDEESLVDSDESFSDDSEEIDLSMSPLHSVSWGRVILDEAHRVKQRTNSTASAAFHLKADHRWCLSGTPLQNRVGELHSLLRFLRFSPFAYYYCKAKGCECKSLDYVFKDNRYCNDCGHTKMQHFSYFKQTISNPIVKFGFTGAGSDAMTVLKTQVLDKVLLRRTKEERHADLQLPPIETLIRKEPLGDAERDFYEALYSESRTKFDTFAASGTLLHNYAHIFELLTKLRQAADHPYLLTKRKSQPVTPEPSDIGVCGLCADDIGPDEVYGKASCGHSFHKDCSDDYIRSAPQLPLGGVGCPCCFHPLHLVFPETADDDTIETSANKEDEISKVSKTSKSKAGAVLEGVTTTNFQTSVKLEMLVDEISRMPENDKCLVFSQFTRMLEISEFRLRQEGIACARLTGAQTLKQRSNVVLAFHRDPSLRVLLISLKAGGEGVNLQVANRIFLLDPWWNPASELQAIQRAHRIGQTKPVRAIRFIASNTIEEKILQLQEKKQLVFDGTVGQSNGALAKLTGEDLAFLFQN